MFVNGLPGTILWAWASALVGLGCLGDQPYLVALEVPWQLASPYFPCYPSFQANHSAQANQPDQLNLVVQSVQIYQACHDDQEDQANPLPPSLLLCH